MLNEFVDAYLGLGSNLKDPKRNLQHALNKISKVKHTRLIKTSRYYLTSPVGGIAQNDFINGVCMVQTKLSAMQLLEEIQQIEKDLGKIFRTKNGPREIDIDILFYENQSIQQNELVIPHPRWQNRLFVLYPLSDLVENIHYVEKKISYSFNIKDLICNFTNNDNQKIQVMHE